MRGFMVDGLWLIEREEESLVLSPWSLGSGEWSGEGDGCERSPLTPGPSPGGRGEEEVAVAKRVCAGWSRGFTGLGESGDDGEVSP